MTQGFYEQLGVKADATADEIREAYARVVAQLARRHRALTEQGGDVSAIAVSQAQLKDAWDVLSDPLRRRRYDAMLALTSTGTPRGDELWDQVRGALIDPAAAAAADLLRGLTTLSIPDLPAPPGRERRRAPPPAPLGDPDQERTVTMPGTPRPSRADRPESGPHGADRPDLRVVDGSPSAPPVIVLPDPPSAREPRAPEAPRIRRPHISTEDMARLVDQHGYCGALLRAVREARGLTLQEVGETTRISIKFLEAIEGDRHDALPSATFVRGYVREMARVVGIDEAPMVSGYMRNL